MPVNLTKIASTTNTNPQSRPPAVPFELLEELWSPQKGKVQLKNAQVQPGTPAVLRRRARRFVRRR